MNVAADESGVTTSTSDDGLHSGHGGVSVDGATHSVRQRLPGELVDHVEDLDHPPGGGDAPPGR